MQAHDSGSLGGVCPSPSDPARKNASAGEAEAKGKTRAADATDTAAAQLEATRPELPKAQAGRIARAALAGHELRRLADGKWLATRWCFSKELADDAACDAWLDVVGAPK